MGSLQIELLQTANWPLQTEKMKITLQNIGRRFNRDWIFKNIDYTFTSGQSYAILGPNGSGKSTLLQILNGSLSPSAGNINYSLNESPLEIETVFKQLSLAAPYLELIEEFTLDEMIGFHFRFTGHNKEVFFIGMPNHYITIIISQLYNPVTDFKRP